MVKHLVSKIAISIYLLVAIGLGIWGYTVFKQRDGKVNTISNIQTPQTFNNDSSTSTAATDDLTNDNDADNQQASPDQTSSPTDNTSAPTTQVDPNQNSFQKITPDVCADQCKKFKKNQTQFEYCQQVCGITPPPEKTSDNNCSDKTGLQRDYCLKDLAVSKNDSDICSQIIDGNIKKTCQDRILENALESQMQQQSSNQAPAY